MKTLDVPKFKITTDTDSAVDISKEDIEAVLTRSHEDKSQTRHYKITKTSTIEVDETSHEEVAVDKADEKNKVAAKKAKFKCNCFGSSE